MLYTGLLDHVMKLLVYTHVRMGVKGKTLEQRASGRGYVHSLLALKAQLIFQNLVRKNYSGSLDAHRFGEVRP